MLTLALQTQGQQQHREEGGVRLRQVLTRAVTDPSLQLQLQTLHLLLSPLNGHWAGH